ncbi:prolipoprotein diacylglyceryl transferase [Candidatus Uhrbacteria bacterium]|nr:prolipoprotein diacylglyceryl transferase [Candidatus Uhrbacteria bacterium]
MIPYFEWRHIIVGPLTIQTWGLFVAGGILAAAWVSARLARRRGLDGDVVWDVLGWMVGGGLIGARLFHVLFYEPAYYLANPGEIFSFWLGGMAISGGLAGGAITGFLFLKWKGFAVWRYADVLAFGLPLGQFIGRIGCFLNHLHPGTPTDFFLGVSYPDGVVRHDNGLYLSLNGLLLFFIFLLLRRRVREGTFLALFFLWDGVIRFGLDFLRAREGDMVDARYIGLTPAQYVSLAMVAIGGWLWYRRKELPT